MSTYLSMTEEQLLSCFNLSYRYFYQSKNFKTYTIVKRNIHDDESCKEGIAVEF